MKNDSALAAAKLTKIFVHDSIWIFEYQVFTPKLNLNVKPIFSYTE